VPAHEHLDGELDLAARPAHHRRLAELPTLRDVPELQIT
jgi:hypothetical protein